MQLAAIKIMKRKTLQFLTIGLVGISAISIAAQPVAASENTDLSSTNTVESSTVSSEDSSENEDDGNSSESSSETSTETSTTPVPDDSSSEETPPVKDEAPVLSPSTVMIDAYNTDAGKYIDEATFEIKDNSGNTISFSKISSGKYEVDSSGSDRYVTTYNGSVEIKGLNGSYVVRNTTPDGDIRCNTSEQSFSISPEERRSITFEYSANYGTLKVLFVGEDDSAIPNAVFKIKNSNGNTIYFAESSGIYEYNGNSSSSEITTNSTGMAVLHLPGGNYTIEQISAPAEYNGELVTKNITVTNQEEVSISLVNKKKYGSLSISVTDSSDSNIALSGATFTITASNGDNVYVSGSNGKYAFSRTSGDNVITSAGGKIEISNLPEGAYTITQKTGAKGYEMSAAKQFDIKADKTTSIAFRNEKSVGTIKITVNDEDGGAPIEGFRYKVLSENKENVLKFRMSAKGYIFDENGSEEVESDENGEIILEKVPVGTYYLQQSQASSGYLLDVDAIEHVVEAGKEDVHNIKAVKSNSMLVIVDSDGNAVSGVSFEITNVNGEKVLKDIANEEGKFVISKLKEGEYKLTIIEVPETFAKYDKVMNFSLDAKGQADGLGRITLEFNKVTLNLGKENIEVVLTSESDGSSIKVKTDSKGIATFTKLSYGEYTITLADDTIKFSPLKFTVDKNFNGAAYNVDIVPVDTSEETADGVDIGGEIVEDTNETVVKKKVNTGVICAIVAALIALAGGISAYMYYKKKKETESETVDSEESDEEVKYGFDEDGNAVLYSEVEVDMDEDTNTDNEESIDDSESLVDSEDADFEETEEVEEHDENEDIYGLQDEESATIDKEEQED